MDRRALDHPLKRGCWHGLGPFNVCDEGRQVVVNKIGERFAQRFEVHAARLHDLRGVRLVHKCQQQVLKGGQLVVVRVGRGQRLMDCLLKRGRK